MVSSYFIGSKLEKIVKLQNKHCTEAVARKCSAKKMFWRVFQNSLEKDCNEALSSKVGDIEVSFCVFRLKNNEDWPKFFVYKQILKVL